MMTPPQASIAPDLLSGVYALAKVCRPHGVYSRSLPAIAVLAAMTMVLAYCLTGPNRRPVES